MNTEKKTFTISLTEAEIELLTYSQTHENASFNSIRGDDALNQGKRRLHTHGFISDNNLDTDGWADVSDGIMKALKESKIV